MKRSKERLNDSVDPARSRHPRLSARPRQYVDVNDLRALLKLGLGLHLSGDPVRRLTRALNGLGKLASAEAWIAAVIRTKGRGPAKMLSAVAGGINARALEAQLEADCLRPESAIRKLLAEPAHIPGRVLAVIARDDKGRQDNTGRLANFVQSILRPEASGTNRNCMTWISIHRGAAPFQERERRLVELFHSQTAWLLLRM